MNKFSLQNNVLEKNITQHTFLNTHTHMYANTHAHTNTPAEA